MTKTEAIELLEKDIKLHEVFNETKYQNKAIEALNMAIESLAKEPKEDCVSREWVMNLYKEWQPILATKVHEFGYALKCAPSVVPKREIPPNMEQVLIPKHCIVPPNDTVLSAAPKRGKWQDMATELSASFERHEFVCSECACAANYFVGGSEEWWDTRKPNYCPNCGARMESDGMTREEAITILTASDYFWLRPSENEAEALNMAIEALEQELKRGEWIKTSNDWIDGHCGQRFFPYHCGCCGYKTWDDELTNYCPNCGARMEGDDK